MRGVRTILAQASSGLGVWALLALSCSGQGPTGPVACPEGADARHVEFQERTRALEDVELSAEGWRCVLPDGRRHGPSWEWFENGQPSAFSEWRQGEKHGPFVLWYPTGQKRSEGAHARWEAVGRWTLWDRHGNVLDERDFGGEPPVSAGVP